MGSAAKQGRNQQSKGLVLISSVDHKSYAPQNPFTDFFQGTYMAVQLVTTKAYMVVQF